MKRSTFRTDRTLLVDTVMRLLSSSSTSLTQTLAVIRVQPWNSKATMHIVFECELGCQPVWSRSMADEVVFNNSSQVNADLVAVISSLIACHLCPGLMKQPGAFFYGCLQDRRKQRGGDRVRCQEAVSKRTWWDRGSFNWMYSWTNLIEEKTQAQFESPCDRS